jgi:Rps23 Pro-64 3,4-dihydroxylase Tpa1-like proline 4-hydroxylase
MIFLGNLLPRLSGNSAMSSIDTKLSDLINREVFDHESALASGFQHAQPFRHVVIDNFLNQEFCDQICREFPEFQTSKALNENDEVGGKATREKVRALGGAFCTVDDLMKAPDFLALVGRITGVPELHYDPFYFGGGTHENREGQDLDPHVDFNYHPVSNQHRRLNLIIYLNPEWDDSWGGSLQLHSDPYRETADDQVVTLTPLKNRCVIFETNEHSWHGFEQICLPDDSKSLSRKSFAVYFYTDLRPAEELAVEHSTVYVERHLPQHFVPGLELSNADLQEIKRLLARRDQHLKRLYQNIQDQHGQINKLRLSSGGAPLMSSNRKEDFPAEMEGAVQVIANLRQRIIELESSTSWRLTAPVRAVKNLFSGKP